MSHLPSETAPNDDDDDGVSRGRVLGIAIIAYLLVACTAYFFLFQIVPDFSEEATKADVPAVVAQFSPSAYAAPEVDVLVSAEQRTVANLRVGADTAALTTILAENPTITTIYVHPALVDELESHWLQEQYRAGKLMVAINTPLSRWAAVLDTVPQQPDLPFETFSTSPITVAILRYRADAPPLALTAAYTQFNQVPVLVQGLR